MSNSIIPSRGENDDLVVSHCAHVVLYFTIFRGGHAIRFSLSPSNVYARQIFDARKQAHYHDN